MMHLLAQLTPDTGLTIPLNAVIPISGLLICATWAVAAGLFGIRNQLRGLRDDVRESWTRREQERWSAELERENRAIGLIVPQVPPVPPAKDD
jgi:hypothetical protein